MTERGRLESSSRLLQTGTRDEGKLRSINEGEQECMTRKLYWPDSAVPPELHSREPDALSQKRPGLPTY